MSRVRYYCPASSAISQPQAPAFCSAPANESKSEALVIYALLLALASNAAIPATYNGPTPTTVPFAMDSKARARSHPLQSYLFSGPWQTATCGRTILIDLSQQTTLCKRNKPKKKNQKYQQISQQHDPGLWPFAYVLGGWPLLPLSQEREQLSLSLSAFAAAAAAVHAMTAALTY